MLIHVTRVAAILSENLIIFPVGNDPDGCPPVGGEPLGALSPLGDVDGRGHLGVVTSAADFSGIVVGADESGVVGVEEVGVDGGEVVERNACVREQDEALVCYVKKGVRK